MYEKEIEAEIQSEFEKIKKFAEKNNISLIEAIEIYKLHALHVTASAH
jgi:hypothetical protein